MLLDVRVLGIAVLFGLPVITRRCRTTPVHRTDSRARPRLVEQRRGLTSSSLAPLKSVVCAGFMTPTSVAVQVFRLPWCWSVPVTLVRPW